MFFVTIGSTDPRKDRMTISNKTKGSDSERKVLEHAHRVPATYHRIPAQIDGQDTGIHGRSNAAWRAR